MNPGDFVRHSRQGPGRITQIFPDYVEVKAAAGHLFNVNRDLIKFELEKFPPDGFVALLATRHPSSDFLLENIVDVALRIFRDHRKSSLPQKEFRLALEPFVRRDGKSYASWWKRAKPKLLATGSVIPHPKKKTSLALAKEFTSESSMDWEAELENIKSDAALLDYARRLFASDADNDRASMAAANALERAVRELHASEEHSHAHLECVLALLYLGSRAEQHARDKWLNVIDGIEFHNLQVTRDLDDDVVIALGLISKLNPSKAAEWADTLLGYPGPAVAKRAFTTLNVDRFRSQLKEPFLEWLRSEKSPEVPNLDLYLDDTFLRNIRREDKAALYVRLSHRVEHSPPERRFLSNPENTRIVGELYRSDPVSALRVVPGAGLDQASCSELIKTLGADKALVDMLQEFRPEYGVFLSEAIRMCSWEALLNHSSQLINVLQLLSSPEASNAFARRLVTELPNLSGLNLLRATTLGCELSRHAADSGAITFDRSLQVAFLKLLNDPSTDIPQLNDAMQTEIARITGHLNGRLHAANEELAKSIELLREAERESARFRSLAEIVKSSAKEERTSLKREALSSFVAALLPALDELERQSRGENDASRRFYLDLIAAFEQAGLHQIGSVGATEPFDPQIHRLLQESEATIQLVCVIRTGFVLRDGDGSVVIRPALVRPIGGGTS
jgi:molecular chaperone GrpE (heat shock protein)